MADGGGERRMVFDTRGRRKHVVRVVYAVLALLMGGSLFLTVGPFNIGEFFGNGGTSTDASEVFHDQAERIEGRLVKNPNDEGALVSLTRVRIQAGNAQTEIDPQTGAPGIPPPEAVKDFDAAQESWSRYLKQAGDDPNPAVAQLVAQTFFTLAERGSSTLSEIEENLETAVKAQRIAAEARPNAGSLSSLAIYEYFNGNMAAGDKAAKQAVARTVSKPEAKNAEKQLNEYRKRATQYVTSLEQASKAEQKAGGEQLQNPLGGFGAGATAPGG
jgi:hypothetical protein